MLLVSRRHRVLGINPEAQRLLGWAEHELLGTPINQLIPKRAHQLLDGPPESTARPADRPAHCGVRRRDGTTLRTMLTREPWESGGAGQSLLTLHDLTFPGRAILESMGDAVVMTDLDGDVSYLNPAAVRLTGWGNDEALGQPVSTLMVLVSESSREPIPDTTTRCLREGRPVDLEDGVLLIRRDGTEVPIGDSAAPIREADGTALGVVLIVRDERERRRVGDRLTFEASHDDLTGLVNRREFERRLTDLRADPAGGTAPEGVLLYLDLDNFKQINDLGGHEAGDRVLQSLGSLLVDQMRMHDTAARLGGDEFGALLADCSLMEAIRIAENLRAAIARHRFESDGRVFALTASIGLHPVAPTSGVAAALRAADAACYAAKRAGGGRVQFAESAGDAAPKPRIRAARVSPAVRGRGPARESAANGPSVASARPPAQ